MADIVLPAPVRAFKQRYRELCGDTPTAEQALLMKYFDEALDELPVFNDRCWFYKAWRVADIIPTRVALCSKDMVVWHLLKLCPVIDQVVMEQLPEKDPHGSPNDF